MAGDLLGTTPLEEGRDEPGGSGNEQDDRQGELDEGEIRPVGERIKAHLTETNSARE
jgi:hypothetical protein